MKSKSYKGGVEMTFSEKILEEGRKEGEKKARRETAKKMKAKGLNLELIAETTGLSKNEIEKL
jgi:predicted transposase/invertase (TIGR01784 family)